MIMVKPDQRSPEVACCGCGEVMPRYEVADSHGRCQKCASGARWLIGVWIGLTVLIVLHFAALGAV